MLAPTESDLKSRLQERFPKSTADIQSGAHALVDALAKNWAALTEPQRVVELRTALTLSEGSVDAQLAYLRTAVDLQVTKASALRTYSALLLGSLGFIFQDHLTVQDYPTLGPTQGAAIAVTAVCAVLAAVITISTSFTSWPTTENFKSGDAEVDWLVKLLVSRGRRVNLAVILTLAATAALVVVVGAFALADRIG